MNQRRRSCANRCTDLQARSTVVVFWGQAGTLAPSMRRQIALAALFVYAIRFLGMTFGSRLPKTGAVRRAMDALPGTIFAALVFPSLGGAGAPGLAAAAVIFITVRKTGSVCLAMLLGMASVSLLRLAIPG